MKHIENLKHYLESLGVEVNKVESGELSPGLYVDLHIPSANAAILFCNLEQHSEPSKYGRRGHQQACVLAAERDIRLIVMFEDEWIKTPDIVKSRLQSLVNKNVKLHARKCKIETRSSKEVGPLLDQWHTQGARFSNKNICLISKETNEIVGIITYGCPRYGKEDIEIIRYATRPGYTVVGGFSRLFNQVIEVTGANTIASYSDNRWGPGNVYKCAGLKFHEFTQASYYYFKHGDLHRHHRSSFMKHKIIKNLGGDPNLTEIENMRIFGYERIFDAGTTKWIWTRESVDRTDAETDD